MANSNRQSKDERGKVIECLVRQLIVSKYRSKIDAATEDGLLVLVKDALANYFNIDEFFSALIVSMKTNFDEQIFSSPILSQEDASKFVKSACYGEESVSFTSDHALLINIFIDVIDILNSVGVGRDAGEGRASGVSIIHRIWLGKIPSEEKILIAMATNVTLCESWKNKSKFESYFWVENSRLKIFFESVLPRRVKVVLIDDLIDGFLKKHPNLKWLQARVKAFILQRRYAFATDILRLMTLYMYGGLYLDFEFRSLRLNDVGKGCGFSFFHDDIYHLPVNFSPSLIGVPGQDDKPAELFHSRETVFSSFSDSAKKVTENKFRDNIHALSFQRVENSAIYIGAPYSEHALSMLKMLEDITVSDIRLIAGRAANAKKIDSVLMPIFHSAFDRNPINFGCFRSNLMLFDGVKCYRWNSSGEVESVLSFTFKLDSRFTFGTECTARDSLFFERSNFVGFYISSMRLVKSINLSWFKRELYRSSEV
ncbi:glycosyltransferase [Pelagibaculum spongiae]|uniref:GT44 domain-containing protein n=1 Tax=Pelagibaculum spongiae TaxID=2080658 RepID=A0A2V1GQV3_9GAMM|nr:glycosyltransferase [Pelagibaculum spongiae]PVZ66669.1 hypothetical protein DC094_15480 [Pelagibaculum spongiae]